MAMIEGMTSIDLGTSPIQETTADINDAMPDEPIETSEERSVINKSKHTSPHICMCVCSVADRAAGGQIEIEN